VAMVGWVQSVDRSVAMSGWLLRVCDGDVSGGLWTSSQVQRKPRKIQRTGNSASREKSRAPGTVQSVVNRQYTAHFQNVIPAKAGIQRLQSHASVKPWIPAFAGMTVGGDAAACDSRWSMVFRSKSLDSRVRGNDEPKQSAH
jgi:hypothetical protein